MAEDEDYIEVEAVVRMPKGARLADSKKNEGWSVGFTPNSTEKGPEHVGIKLKDLSGSAASGTKPVEPQFVYGHEYIESPPEKSREQEEFEELLQALVLLGMVKTIEWAQPRLKRLWDERVIPFLNARRHQWQERREQRRAKGQAADELAATVAPTMLVEGTKEVGDALDAYKANMTSAEARRHFAEALIARRFADEKMRLLSDARIEEVGPGRELADAVQALTPKQVETTLNSILASRPQLLDELGKLLATARNDQLQLGGGKMHAALRLADGR